MSAFSKIEMSAFGVRICLQERRRGERGAVDERKRSEEIARGAWSVGEAVKTERGGRVTEVIGKTS
jgi:hypothetical protein